VLGSHGETASATPKFCESTFDRLWDSTVLGRLRRLQAVLNAYPNDLIGSGRSGPPRPCATMRKNTLGHSLLRFFRCSLGGLVLTKFFTRRRYQAPGDKITLD
jgi:hypothetical protein